VTVQGETWRASVPNFTQSIVNVWPFLLLCLMAAFISGSAMWLLVSFDRTTKYF